VLQERDSPYSCTRRALDLSVSQDASPDVQVARALGAQSLRSLVEHELAAMEASTPLPASPDTAPEKLEASDGVESAIFEVAAAARHSPQDSAVPPQKSEVASVYSEPVEMLERESGSRELAERPSRRSKIDLKEGVVESITEAETLREPLRKLASTGKEAESAAGRGTEEHEVQGGSLYAGGGTRDGTSQLESQMETGRAADGRVGEDLSGGYRVSSSLEERIDEPEVGEGVQSLEGRVSRRVSGALQALRLRKYGSQKVGRVAGLEQGQIVSGTEGAQRKEAHEQEGASQFEGHAEAGQKRRDLRERLNGLKRQSGGIILEETRESKVGAEADVGLMHQVTEKASLEQVQAQSSTDGESALVRSQDEGAPAEGASSIERLLDSARSAPEPPPFVQILEQQRGGGREIHNCNLAQASSIERLLDSARSAPEPPPLIRILEQQRGGRGEMQDSNLAPKDGRQANVTEAGLDERSEWAVTPARKGRPKEELAADDTPDSLHALEVSEIVGAEEGASDSEGSEQLQVQESAAQKMVPPMKTLVKKSMLVRSRQVASAEATVDESWENRQAVEGTSWKDQPLSAFTRYTEPVPLGYDPDGVDWDLLHSNVSEDGPLEDSSEEELELEVPILQASAVGVNGFGRAMVGAMGGLGSFDSGDSGEDGGEDSEADRRDRPGETSGRKEGSLPDFAGRGKVKEPLISEKDWKLLETEPGITKRSDTLLASIRQIQDKEKEKGVASAGGAGRVADLVLESEAEEGEKAKKAPKRALDPVWKLDTPIDRVKCLTPKQREKLKEAEFLTARQLLQHYPKAIIDSAQWEEGLPSEGSHFTGIGTVLSSRWAGRGVLEALYRVRFYLFRGVPNSFCGSFRGA
jgi:hypothetical protein